MIVEATGRGKPVNKPESESFDVMIDIETLGTKPGCVILSIGAIQFHPKSSTYNSKTFYSVIDIGGQVISGLTVDPDTLKWWREQSIEAQEVITRGDRDSLSVALKYLAEFCTGANKIWAKPPDFDLAILEFAYDLTGISVPWTFRQKVDVRVIDYLANVFDIPLPDFEGVKHNAESDCVNQIRLVQAVVNCIEDWRRPHVIREMTDHLRTKGDQ